MIEFEDGDLRAFERRLRDILARFEPSRTLTPKQQRILQHVREKHGRSILAGFVRDRLELAKSENDIEAARSLIAYWHGVDVEGSNWTQLQEALESNKFLVESQMLWDIEDDRAEDDESV